MGRGRKKTKTLNMGNIQNSPNSNASTSARELRKNDPNSNVSISARHLRKNDLGAVIFGCKHSTMKECLCNQLFGLPGLHISYVKSIRPGLPLFLFNYSDRKMHGIFEAASDGQWGINMYGWTDGSEKTPYPAQVRIRIRKQCQSLSEEQYKPILADNYYGQSHYFWFELDHAQTGALLSLFESYPLPTSLTDSITIRTTGHQASNYNSRCNGQETSQSSQKLATSDSARAWSSLFEEQTNSDARNQNEKVKLSETDYSTLDYGNMGKLHSNEPVREAIDQAPCNNDRTDEERMCNSGQSIAFSNSTPKWSSLFKKKPNNCSGTQDYKLKSLISGSDCNEVDNGDLGERHSSTISEWDEEFEGSHIQETDPDEEKICNSAQKLVFSNSASKQPSLFKEKPNNHSGTSDNKLKSLTSASDCNKVDNGGMGERHSSPIYEWDEEIEGSHIQETDPDKEGIINYEKRVYLKLKQIAIERGSLNFFQKDHTKETSVMLKLVEPHLEDEYSPEALSVPENSDTEDDCASCMTADTHFEDEYPLESPSKGCEDVPIDPSSIKSLINQLRGELIQSMEALSRDQSRKSIALEKKMACLHVELQQLKKHVASLASQLKSSSTTCFGEPLKAYGNGKLTERPDVPQLCMKELIYIMGGCKGDYSPLSTVECYSTAKDVVRHMRPMSSPRSFSSAAVLSGYVFNFGGFADPSGSTTYDTVECYNPWSDDWIPCSPLSERKGCLASATLHNKIYALGGGGDGHCTSRVEMYDPDLGRWIVIQSLLQKRFSAAAAELKGVLYVVGGYDGNYLNSAERFDPREGSWSRLPSMNTRRGSHSIAVLNEKLYVLGGFEELHKMVPTVEVFDPRMESWVIVDKMKQPRGYCFAPVIGETIYAVGGMKARGIFADTVEYYKEDRGWSETNLKGIGERSFFSAALL